MMERTYTYKTVGSCNIQADIFRLADEQIRPVIVWIHGGCLMRGSRKDIGSRGLMSYVNQ
ncbi:MAG: lip2 [Paenibacillus sp.]|jgi:acetyl esterase/lipase|nr:lip2 [Paenibacillus sp.]